MSKTKKEEVNFLPVGTTVQILSSPKPHLTGDITCVKISGTEHRVTYEVTWWSGVTTKSSDWFEPYQISTEEPVKTVLGFSK